ncbi:methionine--tRNA ligase [Buchnera aphidicola (Taiwanaphis decaspermi)]|uniref:methionine--tRNA ligase n=1 Tax=Buchnera aphidicola TaxID=9 RepID=UPI0031B82610
MKKKIMREIIVTCAFPYANGSIHLGHMLEHIQADIWVRYLRMNNNKVWFICSDDAHGTPIMLKSKKMNISPEKMVNQMFKNHKKDFINFNIKHDLYSTTHRKTNLFFVEKIYHLLKKKKLIEEKNVYQFYDICENMFLPDRFVKGNCPICKSYDQYGENCDICGATYNPIELIDPYSTVSHSKPVLKKTNHLFFNLSFFKKFLKKWQKSNVLQKQVYNKMKEWFKIGLKDWNISRDKPYFGFKIPGFPNKYFYVWLDAPIGYISNFYDLSRKKNIDFYNFWKKTTKTELYHFIGKDITYFHSLFWPAILKASNLRQPTKIFVHGYLTINGKKISKSKGDIITSSEWIKKLDSDSLRYYLASKMSPGIEDIEINFSDFCLKINSEVVNKIVNIASRCSSFINKKFYNILSDKIYDINIYKKFVSQTNNVLFLFENREFSKLINKVLKYSNKINKYFTEKKPWLITNNNLLQNICSICLNLFRIIATWLKPIMPILSKKVEFFLNTKLLWKNIDIPLLKHKIRNFNHLYEKININLAKEFKFNNF